jgi:ribosomal protein S18 acetylase RimI-like enzyme
MMDSIVIYRTDLDELDALRTISISTFEQAFAKDNSPENMRSYIASAFSAEQLDSELLQTKSEFYFAKKHNQLIGYLKINFIEEDSSMEIERIYIEEAFHGKGVAALLMDKALQRAREQLCSRVWLGVWEHNPKAIRFYTKYGFEPYDQHTFLLGDDEQTDIRMQKKL